MHAVLGIRLATPVLTSIFCLAYVRTYVEWVVGSAVFDHVCPLGPSLRYELVTLVEVLFH